MVADARDLRNVGPSISGLLESTDSLRLRPSGQQLRPTAYGLRHVPVDRSTARGYGLRSRMPNCWHYARAMPNVRGRRHGHWPASDGRRVVARTADDAVVDAAAAGDRGRRDGTHAHAGHGATAADGTRRRSAVAPRADRRDRDAADRARSRGVGRGAVDSRGEGRAVPHRAVAEGRRARPGRRRRARSRACESPWTASPPSRTSASRCACRRASRTSTSAAATSIRC